MSENRAKYGNEEKELSIGDLMKLAKSNKLFLCKIEERAKKIEQREKNYPNMKEIERMPLYEGND